jgi:hypothetical protein
MQGSAMTWTYIQKLEAHFAEDATYRCRVYHDPPQTWLAIVTRDATSIVQEGFPSAEAAIAWCEAYVRNLL